MPDPDDDADASRSGEEVEPPGPDDGDASRADDRPTGGEAEPLGDLARRLRERRAERAGSHDGDGDAPDGATDDSAAGSRAGTTRRAAGDRPDRDDLADFGTDDAGDDPFEEMDVADVDTDAVWDAVLDEETDAAGTDAVAGTGPAAVAADAETAAGDDQVVDKAEFCESCRFFTAPPTVACSYEGSEIVEVVDTERFRVRNCPVVAGTVGTDGRDAGDGGRDAGTEGVGVDAGTDSE
jgi:hypothetical protein